MVGYTFYGRNYTVYSRVDTLLDFVDFLSLLAGWRILANDTQLDQHDLRALLQSFYRFEPPTLRLSCMLYRTENIVY
jgi:hypothetical protein